MDHTLIYTIIGSIVAAFALGMLAVKMRLPAIFGYLLAGVVIGPHTPGFVADVTLARQLAEIGVILLMFGVGLHFSLRDLLNVRKIALPGALVQMLSATAIGAAAAHMLNYDPVAGLIFGLSLSVASTIVLLRSLENRNMLDSEGGKLAIGWLIVEDIAMVLALVMLPVIADLEQSGESLTLKAVGVTILAVLFKVGGFFAFMLIAGRRFLPWLLNTIAAMRSSELTTLATLAIALGFASVAYIVFDASFALGAFLAGMMLNESAIGRKAAENTLPMRDAFSVLFFVSVGMLFDPMTLVYQPVAVLITFLIVVPAKGLAALAIAHWFKQPRDVGHTVAIGLAQIGEFSFILGSLALSKNLITHDMYSLILAGAMLSIVINPFLFRIGDAVDRPSAPPAA
jgi:monovalent cation:H+ antiporter-2, CPA2 family